jgi:hypothetical protein
MFAFAAFAVTAAATGELIGAIVFGLFAGRLRRRSADSSDRGRGD